MPNPANVEPTVILGGGIISLSTAYYLALAAAEKIPGSSAEYGNIVVVYPSSTMCTGASAQNEGALGDFEFREPVMPLAQLLYQLHDRLPPRTVAQRRTGSPASLFMLSFQTVSIHRT